MVTNQYSNSVIPSGFCPTVGPRVFHLFPSMRLKSPATSDSSCQKAALSGPFTFILPQQNPIRLILFCELDHTEVVFLWGYPSVYKTNSFSNHHRRWTIGSSRKGAFRNPPIGFHGWTEGRVENLPFLPPPPGTPRAVVLLVA